MTFPTFAIDKSHRVPLSIHGDFFGVAKGPPVVDGGAIAVQWRLKGETIHDLRSDDAFVNLDVPGSSIRAAPIASFLNLPFRADKGGRAANIDLDFLYQSL